MLHSNCCAVLFISFELSPLQSSVEEVSPPPALNQWQHSAMSTLAKSFSDPKPIDPKASEPTKSAATVSESESKQQSSKPIESELKTQESSKSADAAATVSESEENKQQSSSPIESEVSESDGAAKVGKLSLTDANNSEEIKRAAELKSGSFPSNGPSPSPSPESKLNLNEASINANAIVSVINCKGTSTFDGAAVMQQLSDFFRPDRNLFRYHCDEKSHPNQSAIIHQLMAQFRVTATLVNQFDPNFSWQAPGRMIADHHGDLIPYYEHQPHIVHIAAPVDEDGVDLSSFPDEARMGLFPFWNFPTAPDGTCVKSSVAHAVMLDTAFTNTRDPISGEPAKEDKVEICKSFIETVEAKLRAVAYAVERDPGSTTERPTTTKEELDLFVQVYTVFGFSANWSREVLIESILEKADKIAR